MDFAPVSASTLQIGDPVGLPDLVGWWFVESVRHTDDHVLLGLVPLDRGDPVERAIGRDEWVRKGERAAVHEPGECVGLTLVEAHVWAAALGWRLVGPGDFQFGGDRWQGDTLFAFGLTSPTLWWTPPSYG